MDELDEAAGTSVFERHRSLLFSIAYRMLGSVADAATKRSPISVLVVK